MSKFYVTFGYGHEPYGDSVGVLEASTMDEARQTIYQALHTHWSHVYADSYQTHEMIAKYNLTEVTWDHLVANPPPSTRPNCSCGRSPALVED